MASALSDLVGDARAADFLCHTWPDKSACFHGSLDRLPRFLREGPLANIDSLSRAYRGRMVVSAGNQAQYEVSGLRPAAAVQDLGLTVGFERLENDVLPDAQPWQRALERDLGLPGESASMMAFVNARGTGLSLHCDPYEHFVVQVSGCKTFRLKEHPTARFPNILHGAKVPPGLRHYVQCPDGLPRWRHAPADADRVILQPGSVLFMPRGTYHETESSQDDVAITVAIRVTTTSFADIVLHYLSHFLLQDVAWRTPALGGWSQEPGPRARARQQLGALVTRLAEDLPHLDIDRMFRAKQSGAQLVADMDETVRLQRDPTIELELARHGGDMLALRIVDATGAVVYRGHFQAALEPVLAWLQDRGAAFDFDTIASVFDHWDRASLRTLLAFLVKKRALAIVPIERNRRASA